ncbi:hypothetical protein [Rhodomicrobium lacus]|uniref:hypothetical protein n=1 Tax=Rhodomicrobium lacus TaxID=2498452 RepID=UPI0026E366B1|nr:hypothetical protein [Rhodomicrobium lacus]WKW49794.1 hypothetical protein QMO75_10845 [Rhodomicrobium lacus]
MQQSNGNPILQESEDVSDLVDIGGGVFVTKEEARRIAKARKAEKKSDPQSELSRLYFWVAVGSTVFCSAMAMLDVLGRRH